MILKILKLKKEHYLFSCKIETTLFNRPDLRQYYLYWIRNQSNLFSKPNAEFLFIKI